MPAEPGQVMSARAKPTPACLARPSPTLSSQVWPARATLSYLTRIVFRVKPPLFIHAHPNGTNSTAARVQTDEDEFVVSRHAQAQIRVEHSPFTAAEHVDGDIAWSRHCRAKDLFALQISLGGAI